MSDLHMDNIICLHYIHLDWRFLLDFSSFSDGRVAFDSGKYDQLIQYEKT